jgi:multidrug efflux pump subunit AcrB
LVLTLVGLLCALSVLKFTNLGMSFSPGSQTDDSVNISLTLPVGTDREITQDYLFRAQDLIRENLKGYSSLILTVGSSNTGSIQISLPDIARQTMSAGDMTKALRPLLGSIPGASFSFSTGRGFRSSAPVNIKLVSNDLQAVQAASDRIIEILRAEVSSLSDLQSTLSSGRPQYTLVVDRDRAAALGVSVSRIASELRTALNGVTATTFQDGNDEISVVVRYPDREISSLADLSRISVTGTRDTVSLDNLVSFKSTLSPVSIAREEGIRVNRVTASIHDGSPVTKIQPLVVAALAANLVLPDSVAMEYDGEMQDLDESGGTLILIILVAVFLVFVVMAAQFESLVDPLIIFFSIPLLAIGVVWTYVAAGQAFSLFSAVGVVALVGIVVNNGIILVDYANGLMRKKVPVLEACIVAGKSRLRPILMTTLTTIIATVPMGFFPGEGGELMQPIGITIVGGLASGSLMTLFVTPVMYSLFNKRRERRYDDPESLQNMLAQGEPQRTGD